MQTFWSRKGWANRLLLPLSWLFGEMAALRRFCYRKNILFSAHPGVPVMIVGNITVGGSGKTPFVIWLVQWLQAQGYQPGVVSRGYGRQSKTVHVLDAHSLASQSGDEPLLTHHKTGVPVVVASDRLLACQKLLEQHPQVNILIADDGLQHYRLQRDLELVLIDAGGQFGNAWQLPAGPLREPLSRLQQADALILSQRADVAGQPPSVDIPVFSVRHVPGELCNLRDPGKTKTLQDFSGRSVQAVAGIAKPDAFFAHLEMAGLSLDKRVFADHHIYQQNEIDPQATVIMTEKDAVKCRDWAGADWWAMTLKLMPAPTLERWLVDKLAEITHKAKLNHGQ